MDSILSIAIILFLAICAWSFWRKVKSASENPAPTSTPLDLHRTPDTVSEKNGPETLQPVSEFAIPSLAKEPKEKPQRLPSRDIRPDELLKGKQTPALPLDLSIPTPQLSKTVQVPESKTKATNLDEEDKPAVAKPQAPDLEQRKTEPVGKGKSQQITTEPWQEITSDTAKKPTQERLEPSIAQTKSGESEGEPDTLGSEEDLSSDAVKEDPKKEDLGGKSVPRVKKRTKKRPPPKYQPSIRTPETTKRTKGVQSSETDGSRERSLPVHVHVVLGRRNRCQVSLIPSRAADFEEEINVNGPNGKEIWYACQDEWYSDISADNIGFLLEKGGTWEAENEGETIYRWVLSRREIYILARCSTINAYVSTTRLILNEDHIVLCTECQAELVKNALTKAGCYKPTAISGNNGVPEGWVLFHNVCPTCPVEHDEAAGIFNILLKSCKLLYVIC